MKTKNWLKFGEHVVRMFPDKTQNEAIFENDSITIIMGVF